MNKVVLFTLIVAFVGLVAGVFKFGTDVYYGVADLNNGEKLFAANCIACHGSKGLGDGVAADSLNIKPDNIYEELRNPFGFKAELIESVLSGDNGEGGQMPAFKEILSDKDVFDIFAYITDVNQSN